MEPSALSLVPPVVTIGLAIATKRIFLALGVGIVLGALLHNQWNVGASLSLVGEVAAGLVIADGEIAEEMYISAFVLLLGVLTAFIYLSGGLTAFATWAVTKVRTRFQAHLVPIVLGIVIFFDDAFSCLVGGNVSRSITDQHRVSRAPRLASSTTMRPGPHPTSRVGPLQRRNTSWSITSGGRSQRVRSTRTWPVTCAHTVRGRRSGPAFDSMPHQRPRRTR
jgi:hypothetical protein